jgi:hypothetical protein
MMTKEAYEIAARADIKTQDYAYLGGFIVAPAYRGSKVSTLSSWQRLMEFAEKTRGYAGVLSYVVAP